MVQGHFRYEKEQGEREPCFRRRRSRRVQHSPEGSPSRLRLAQNLPGGNRQRTEQTRDCGCCRHRRGRRRSCRSRAGCCGCGQADKQRKRRRIFRRERSFRDHNGAVGRRENPNSLQGLFGKFAKTLFSSHHRFRHERSNFAMWPVYTF